ncbi:MAG: EAL domain-containing protein [Gammaproteobacteria bacterium]|nr:EAL domain-containing protein [Gammaproteobacteria bacterium]
MPEAPHTAHSLTRRLMVQAGLAIIVLTSGLTAISYRHIAAYSEANVLENLEIQVKARTERESQALRQAEVNHGYLHQALLAEYHKGYGPEQEPAFAARVAQDGDGAWRSRPERFRPDEEAGIWIDNDARMTPELKARVLLFQRLASEYGRAWQGQFLNTYILAEENLAVPFWPSAPEILKQLDSGFDIRAQEYYAIAAPAANPQRRTVWTGLYPDPQTQVWMVSVETPIYAGERHIGTVGNDLRLSELVERTLAPHSSGAYDLLLRADGRLIVHPQYQDAIQAKEGRFYIGEDGTPDLKRLHRLITQAGPGLGIVRDPEGQRILAVGRVLGPDWYYVRVLPEAVVAQLARSTAGLVLLFGALALVAALVVLHGLLKRHMAKPLQQLTAAAERLAQGHADPELPIARDDEIGRLAESFAHMSRALTERDQVLAEQLEALGDSESRFRIAFEHAPIGVAQVDLEGRFIATNASLCAMLGYSPAELQGTNFLNYTHPEDKAASQAQALALNQGETRAIQFEKRYLTRDGATIWALVSSNLQTDASGKPRYLLTHILNITSRKQAESELHRLAFHDHLTGLPNRALFTEFLRQAIKRSARAQGPAFAVMFLDLDRFKLINDSLGHLSGDSLLKEMARRLRALLRPGDVAARFGGDEFCVLVENPHSIADVENLALRMQEGLAQSIELGGEHIRSLVSIGIVLGDAQRGSPEEYLRDADSAMYEAKRAGRNRYRVFEPSMHAHAQNRLRLEADLRRALQNDEFEVYYQPILNLGTRRIERLEALVRWRHPERGLLAPGFFISAAEDLELIAAIDRLVLRKALAQLALWRREEALAELRLNVNASSQWLGERQIGEDIAGELARQRLPSRVLNVEITESVLIEEPEKALTTLQHLREQGVGIHLDDFGSGYSSLSYLHRFPIDQVKLDRSFINRLEDSPKDRAIVEAVIFLAQRLGLQITAEGVESEEQLERLDTLHANCIQGYWLSPPLAADEITRLLLEHAGASAKAMGTAEG